MKVAAASAHGFVLTVHRRRLLVVITTVFPLCSRTAPVLSISLGAAPEAQVGCTPGPTGVCQGLIAAPGRRRQGVPRSAIVGAGPDLGGLTFAVAARERNVNAT